jgi:hypothetical protein
MVWSRRKGVFSFGSRNGGNRSGVERLVAINSNADAHAAMCDATPRYAAWEKDAARWESCTTIMPLTRDRRRVNSASLTMLVHHAQHGFSFYPASTV